MFFESMVASSNILNSVILACLFSLLHFFAHHSCDFVYITATESPKQFAPKLAEALQAEVIQVIGGVIVLYRKADPDRIAEKKKKRGSGSAKAKAKKKVKIKGLRQRQREKEAKNPYAVYDRMNKDKNKKQSRTK